MATSTAIGIFSILRLSESGPDSSMSFWVGGGKAGVATASQRDGNL